MPDSKHIRTECRIYFGRVPYGFAYDCAPAGYTLTINGKVIASNIPYAAPGTPACFKIEHGPGGTSYVGSP